MSPGPLPRPPVGPPTRSAAGAGAMLAAARRERGLTAEDVARETRIRTTLLLEIEADRFDSCGAAVYARGHLRSIAAALGIAPGPVVAAYEQVHGELPAPEQTVALHAFQPEVDTAGRRERRGPNWTAAMAVATAVVTAFAVATILSPDRKPSDSALASAPPTATGSPAAPPARAQRPPARPARVAPAGVTVVLRVTGGPSWVRVRASNEAVVLEKVLTPGMVLTFHDAKLLRLRIGNPGFVTLVVNGRQVGPLGPAGQPVNVVYGPGDPTVAAG